MDDTDGVEFEMPLQFEGHLAGDPQFDGMKRRYWVSRAAITKAIDAPELTLPAADLYDEFFFDVWMAIKDEGWRKKPEAGIVRLGPDDIK